MSNLSQFGFGNQIKSIQRGVITVGTGQASATATITEVDTSKSILSLLGVSTSLTYASSQSSGNRLFYLTLTNSTTITATGGTIRTTDQATLVSWQIVEYY